MKALDLSVEEVRSHEPADVDCENVPAGTPNVKSTHRMRRADALALMAESEGQISRSVPNRMAGVHR